MDGQSGSPYQERQPPTFSCGHQVQAAARRPRCLDSTIRMHSLDTTAVGNAISSTLKSSPKTSNPEMVQSAFTPHSDQCTIDSKKDFDAIPSSCSILSTTTIQIAIGANEQWQQWFQMAFELLRQLACRDVAREWIKVIHPRKQATHPYNGRLAGNKELAPEMTKPPYWPRDVKHKEPDHISKEERVKLLRHLLTNTPHRQMRSNNTNKPKLIYAETLLSVLEKVRERLDRFQQDIIFQIVNARIRLEKFSSRKYDPYLTIQVPDYSGISHKTMRSSIEDNKTALLHDDRYSGIEDEDSNRDIFGDTRAWSTSLGTRDSMREILPESSHQSRHSPVLPEVWARNSDMMPILMKRSPIPSTRASSELDKQLSVQPLSCQDKVIRLFQMGDSCVGHSYRPTESQVNTDHWSVGNVHADLLDDNFHNSHLVYHQAFDPSRIGPKSECFYEGIDVRQSQTTGNYPH